MTTTVSATTAQLIQSHDFASVGDGYAVIRAANQITRSNSMQKLSSLIEGLQEQLRELERLRDLKLSDRLQQIRLPLVNPVDGQVLGIQSTALGGLPALRADLASMNLVPKVDSWYFLHITQDTSPPTATSQFLSPDQRAYVFSLLADASVRDLGSFLGIHQYESISNDGGTTVRTTFALGESAIQTLAPNEIVRLQQGVQSVMAQRVGEVQQLAGQLAQEQQVAAQEWLHGSDIDAYQQERIRRMQLGLSSTP